MQTKVIVNYIDGRSEIVYEGLFNASAMQVQSKWVLKAKKDRNIKSVIWR